MELTNEEKRVLNIILKRWYILSNRSKKFFVHLAIRSKICLNITKHKWYKNILYISLSEDWFTNISNSFYL